MKIKTEASLSFGEGLGVRAPLRKEKLFYLSK